MTETAESELPKYLEMPPEVPESEALATLERADDGKGSYWLLQGDPQVAQMAKRIFPGSGGRGRGVAKFPATKRTFADLVWFMQRWPIAVRDRDEWMAAYERTCSYVLKRDHAAKVLKPVSPGPKFKGTLRPYQQEGLGWCLTNRRTLLADEQGLGKSPMGLAFVAEADEWPAMIVCQPHLVRHWENEISKFLQNEDGSGVDVHTVKGQKPYDLPEAHVYIVHYLLLSHWRKSLESLAPRTIIFDEIGELRRSESAKYSAASQIADRAENVVGLSGTPIYNRGGEIWNITNIIEYHCLDDWDSFTREWCVAFGSQTVQDPATLGAHLRREGLMLRREKREVISDLPPKRRVVEPIEADDGLYKKLIKDAVSLARNAKDLTDPFEKGRTEHEALRLTRQATGVAKADSVAAFVAGLLEAGEPTLVFAHHHAVMDRLEYLLRPYAPMRITGRETAKQKWAARTAFMNGETDLGLLGLRTIQGLDGLQHHGRVNVFAELDWSPAVHAQAEDRLHRPGVLDSVLCYYLVSDNGTDPDMQEALGLKVSQFVGIFGGEGQTEEQRALDAVDARSHMNKVLEKLRGSSIRT